jgi:hypothetical protein
MTVFNNTHLTSFSGLDGKTTIGGNLTLSSNPALSQAVIDAFLLQVQVHGATTVN